jgi:hypothetical protein
VPRALEQLLLLVLAHLLAPLLDHAAHESRFPRRSEVDRAAGSILFDRPPVKRVARARILACDGKRRSDS